MKHFFLLIILIGMVACSKTERPNSFTQINWKTKAVDVELLRANTSLDSATTYLSVYPQIFNVQESRVQALTVTVSLRNTSSEDTLYVSSARYYNTIGELIRTYFDYPICLMPLETDHIVIVHKDNAGGTGANFVFEWYKKAGAPEPIFEAVMLSTYGQQGISFTSHGVRTK